MSRKEQQENDIVFYHLVTLLICLALIVLAGAALLVRWFVLSGEAEGTRQAWEEARAYDELYFSDKILKGVTVSGYDVGGMTKDEAKAYLSECVDYNIPVQKLELTFGEKTWTVPREELDLTVDVEYAVQKAWEVGRVGDEDARAAQLDKLKNGVPVDVSATIVRDSSLLGTRLQEIAKELDIPAKDATVTFSYNGGARYSYTDEAVGRKADLDKITEDILALVRNNDEVIRYTIETTEVKPHIYRKDLEHKYTLVSAYTTTLAANSNENRIQNITLALESFNNKTWMPGETMSFNAWVGERTAEKGYGEAVFINTQQKYDTTTGGGICQVSTTIFNCALYAGANMRDRNAPIEIIERGTHTWPSEYVKPGLDATVNWPASDLKLYNNVSTPYFFRTFMGRNGSKLTVNVELYGVKLPNNASVEIQTEEIECVPMGAEEYQIDDSLPYGTKTLDRKGHNGYTINVYQVWHQPGQADVKSLLTVSKYVMICPRYIISTDVAVSLGLRKGKTTPAPQQETPPPAQETPAPQETPVPAEEPGETE